MTDNKSPSQSIDSFRDSIATVDEQGKRIWIYPKMPKGFYHRWRIFATVILLAALFGGPFIKVNGQPLFLFNILERKFILFGQAFWPQDFFILAVVLLTFFVFIILFTVVFGRVWCGWMCPQTLFMEMVYRKIEYWIEGDAPSQKRLHLQPWNFEKIWKKTTKHIIFMIISILIAHTVLAYIIGIDETLIIVTNSPADHLTGFITLLVFTAIIYGVYAKFREQACIAVCPYGRLQGVLLTKESIVIAYDWIRGEPRGHLKKNSNITLNTGDCIDCKLCVHVCPTGIDIRNGTQMECVNCTACIDACDDVMIKIGKPKGLIRFASYQGIADSITKIFSARVIGYSIVLIGLLGVLSFTLVTRSAIETTILKVPGTLYQREPGMITNLYNVEFVNKTFDSMKIELKIASPSTAQLRKGDQNEIKIAPEGFTKSVLFIKVPEDQITSAKTTIKIDVYANGELVETVKAKFIGPISTKTK